MPNELITDSLAMKAREMREHGTFTYATDAVNHRERCAMFEQ